MRTVLIAAMLASGTWSPAGVEKWRAEYEAGLKAPDGWLSVAGLFWLHDGANAIGSDPQSDVVLPAGSPPHAGVLRFEAGAVTFEPVSRAKVRMKNEDVKIGEVGLSIIRRGGRTGVRMRDPHAATRREFAGCGWFPIREQWDVRAKWTPYTEPKEIAITNILGMTSQEPTPGYAEFTLLGKTMRLEPVVEDGQLFFMFRDATSGRTTYGAGRFLYAAMPENGVVDLDFNKAKNPPCAFTAFATCPLPPKQNTMPVALEAGELTYGHH